METGYVYFIKDCDNEMVKIGFSSRPKQRLSECRIASAFKLSMICFFPGTKETEKAIHCKMKHLRVRGEWFKVGAEIDGIINSAKSGMLEMEEKPRRPTSVIEALRKTEKMSQADVAKAIGVGVTAVSGWENGYSRPSFDNLVKLSSLFKTRVDKIIDGLKKTAA